MNLQHIPVFEKMRRRYNFAMAIRAELLSPIHGDDLCNELQDAIQGLVDTCICGGQGYVDSGGTDPQGHGINIPCEACGPYRRILSILNPAPPTQVPAYTGNQDAQADHSTDRSET